MNGYLTEILLIVGLVLLNGFFAAAEIALVTARRHALKVAADEGSQGARAALRLTEDPSRYLAAIQIGITLAGFMASATAAVSMAELLRTWLAAMDLPISDGLVAGLSVFLVTLAISYLTLVFGELVPKRIGLHSAEAFASRIARPIGFMVRVAGPLVWLLSASTEAVAALFGVRGVRREQVTEEEIKVLVAEQISLMDEEKRMINEIFELGDTVAREIMVPRVDVVMVEENDPIPDALERFRTSGYSRLPVYREDPDKVVGLLLLKDLIPAPGGVVDGARATAVAAEHMREATFVPETKQVLALMKEMQATRTAMVIVVDEYGGTAGVLTLEDIVEEVVGEIVDEYDQEERYITEVGERDWIVDGRCAVEDARETFGLDFPESEEYETVAGWMLVQLGHIPVPGETIEYDGATIRVQTVRRRRIARLRITRKEHGGETAVQE
jgi:putative hemolysin